MNNFNYSPIFPISVDETEYIKISDSYVKISKTNNKEILKVLVAASPNQSSLTIYGRSNLGNNLIKLNSTVDNSLVKVTVEPADKSQTEKYTGSKVIFGASYFATQNALVGGQQVTS